MRALPKMLQTAALGLSITVAATLVGTSDADARRWHRHHHPLFDLGFPGALTGGALFRGDLSPPPAHRAGTIDRKATLAE